MGGGCLLKIKTLIPLLGLSKWVITVRSSRRARMDRSHTFLKQGKYKWLSCVLNQQKRGNPDGGSISNHGLIANLVINQGKEIKRGTLN